MSKEKNDSKDWTLKSDSIRNIGRLGNTLLKKVNLEIRSYPDFDSKRRLKIINNHKIDTLFDIGANRGQYSKNLRDLGYNGKIISFEPLESAFEKLEKVSSRDKKWIIRNYALGNKNTKSMINVAANSYSSSILNMLPNHLNSAPESKYINRQEIVIKKIDSIYDSFCNIKNNVMIKIDTQGYEKTVLEGAAKSLDKIKIIQLEMSILPLYEDEMLFVDMINFLDQKGFQLSSLENGFTNSKTGQLLQVDGIFTRKE